MSKEELKQEAEEKAGVYFDSLDIDHGNVSDTPFSACDIFDAYEQGALDFAEPREKRIAELEERIEQLQKINNEQKETLKKVRIALIQERAANIINYGKGGAEMFDNMLEVLKGGSHYDLLGK